MSRKQCLNCGTMREYMEGEYCSICQEYETEADTLKARVAELEAENKELDQFLTDACNERDEYAKRAEEAEAVCQVLATQVSLARSGDDGKTRQVSEILDKAREQVKGAE